MKILGIIFVSFLIFSCSTYEPFTSRKDYIKFKKEIERNYDFKTRPSRLVLFELSKSIRDSVNVSHIKRHIDSFNEGHYDLYKFIAFLKLDRMLTKNGWEIDYEVNKNLNYINFNSLEEVEKHLKKFDSVLKIRG